MKKYLYILLVLGVILVIAALMPGKPSQKAFSSYKTAEYSIDGRVITLGTNGTAYFGDEVTGDFNADGTGDVGFIFTSQPGGSGTFYYVAVALGTRGGYIGTDPILIGDRIAPQSVIAQDHGFLVSYATRRDNEPMSTVPHIMVSSFYEFENGRLVYKGSR